MSNKDRRAIDVGLEVRGGHLIPLPLFVTPT